MIRNKQKPAPETEADSRIFELQADICQTLANPKRLQIISLLKKGELSVGDMVKAMGIAKANLSQHLSSMRQKGILIARRQGTSIYYRLASPKITERVYGERARSVSGPLPPRIDLVTTL